VSIRRAPGEQPSADLRIVELARVEPHEEFDLLRIEALAERIQRDGVVRNPPIVAPRDGDLFVVLDGANRTSALKHLKYRDAIVQVVDYGAVELSSWNHAVVGFADGDLVERIAACDRVNLEEVSPDEARRALESGVALAFVSTPDQQVRLLTGPSDLVEAVGVLRDVVNVYNGSSTIHRVEGDEVSHLSQSLGDFDGLVVFPEFSPTDVLAVVDAGQLLPTGISRHVIPGRALRVNYSLDRLAEDRPLEAKNRVLAAWVLRKVQAKEIRYYQEPTILYDE